MTDEHTSLSVVKKLLYAFEVNECCLQYSHKINVKFI